MVTTLLYIMLYTVVIQSLILNRLNQLILLFSMEPLRQLLFLLFTSNM